MAKDTISGTVLRAALAVLTEHPNGLSYGKLCDSVEDLEPHLNPKTIGTQIADWPKSQPDVVYRPERGIFRLKVYSANSEVTTKESVDLVRNVQESDYYESLAKYLLEELEVCKAAKAFGGKTFADVWATPDVIGISKSDGTALCSWETEIISAEIKIATNSADYLTAFGQCCSYRLFSHRVYCVVPRIERDGLLQRMTALCLNAGLGLITFNLDLDNPGYEVRVPARRGDPDTFYLDRYFNDDKNRGALKELFV